MENVTWLEFFFLFPLLFFSFRFFCLFVLVIVYGEIFLFIGHPKSVVITLLTCCSGFSRTARRYFKFISIFIIFLI